MNAIVGALVEPDAAGGSRPISQGSEWTFELLQSYDDAISQVAREYGLDTYPNQIEVITSEQMLDAYASAGLPIGYSHWSYGKNSSATSSSTGAACRDWPMRS